MINTLQFSIALSTMAFGILLLLTKGEGLTFNLVVGSHGVIIGFFLALWTLLEAKKP